MAKNDQQTTPPAEGGAGKGRLKLIIILGLAFLLAVGASVGGTWFFLSRGAKFKKCHGAGGGWAR